MNWLFILGGGFLLYEYLSGAFSGMAASTAPAAATTSAAASPASPVTPSTKTLVAQSAAAAGYPSGALLDWDQWNYFYQKVRGVNGPDFSNVWPNRPRSYQMSIDEWWTGAQSLGLTGGVGSNYMIVPGYGPKRIG